MEITGLDGASPNGDGHPIAARARATAWDKAVLDTQDDPAPPSGHEATVHRGDTLSFIAASNGLSLGALEAANPQLRHPDHLHPGQRLQIPGHAAPGTVAVRRGDTLADIAKAHGTDWHSLARLNGISDPRHLAVGTSLRLPSQTAGAGHHAAHAHPAATDPHAAPAPAGVTADQLRRIMPHAGAQADAFAGALNTAMARHGITSPQQRAAFLAQISVESGDLHDTGENLNYSAQRMTQVWPRRFPTAAAAAPYAHNPQALGDHVYANRMGNGDEASGDGYRYRGRGLMQVTGRANYRAAGFEANPDALSDPQTAADTAAAFWQNNGLNGQTEGPVDRTRFNAVTQIVNGGQTGGQARWDAYQRALSVLQPQGAAH